MVWNTTYVNKLGSLHSGYFNLHLAFIVVALSAVLALVLFPVTWRLKIGLLSESTNTLAWSCSNNGLCVLLLNSIGNHWQNKWFVHAWLSHYVYGSTMIIQNSWHWFPSNISAKETKLIGPLCYYMYLKDGMVHSFWGVGWGVVMGGTTVWYSVANMIRALASVN